MSLSAIILVKYLKKHNPNMKSTSAVKILSSLRLSGRDIFLVIRCGPDVIAFTIGSGGACLMGRWSYDEWIKSEEAD